MTSAALRLTVEVGAPRIRFKTALSVLDHIVDTLPSADGSFCEPLKNNYLKSFRILLDHAPHAEHMRTKQWQTYIDFALASLAADLEKSSLRSANASSRDGSLAPRSDHQNPLRLSQRSIRSTGTGTESVSHAEEIVAALKSLTAITNAPVMTRGPAIAETLKEFLTVASRAQEEAFETLNNIVLASLTEDVAFTQCLIADLLPIIRQMWSSRSTQLRDQMLTILFSCRYLFLSPSDRWSAIDPTISKPLLNLILSEYKTRNEREMLHIDDMKPRLAGQNFPLQLKLFTPVRNSPRGVQCWTTLAIVACLILGLSRKASPVNSADMLEHIPRKKQKIQTPLEELVQTAVEGVGQEKLASIQVLLFVFDQPVPVDQDTAQSILKLLPDLAHEDGSIQSWVYLVFSRYDAKMTSI